MLTSKQRAFLRALAVEADTIVMVGKGGMGEDIISQTDAALTAREIVKGKCLETSPVKAAAAAGLLSAACNADTVQVIGSKFVLYRRNAKDPKITLPKPGRKP